MRKTKDDWIVIEIPKMIEWLFEKLKATELLFKKLQGDWVIIGKLKTIKQLKWKDDDWMIIKKVEDN